MEKQSKAEAPREASPLLAKKMEDGKRVALDALSRYELDQIAVAWTGGKDSTLALYLVKQACGELGLPMPKCFNIDEGDMFPEVDRFIKEICADWGVECAYLHNEDVSRAAGGELGALVQVKDLNERNRREVQRLGYEEESFAYEPESFIGNHLMKTVALNDYLEREKVVAFFEGIRWDEQQSRSSETYFSNRPATPFSPEHTRVCPILHFTERDVWDAHFAYGIPACSLYEKGYRSLGARVSTSRSGDVPAWRQDLENTYERGGRRQDKEQLMEKLRQLGYM